jgi:hypothetical protein
MMDLKYKDGIEPFTERSRADLLDSWALQSHWRIATKKQQ